MNTRAITAFRLSPGQTEALVRAGFTTAADLQGIQPVELAQELKITRQEAVSILKIVNENSNGKAGDAQATALDMLERKISRPPIITFCEGLDKMLGGGVPSCDVTEFCGVPGIGKTQLGIQLAVDVQIPKKFGGTEGSAIYVDTEGSFMVDRVVQIAQAATDHLLLMAKHRKDDALIAEAEAFTVERILGNIHVFRAHDFTEQIAVINVIPKFLNEHPSVRLVVIDSVSFHFRHDFDDFAVRTRTLAALAQNLKCIAEKYLLSMVLMNQVTTKFRRGPESALPDSGGGQSHFAPALGESWAHACTNRIMLTWKDGQRYAEILKASGMRPDRQPFEITREGVRGKRPSRGEKRKEPEPEAE